MDGTPKSYRVENYPILTYDIIKSRRGNNGGRKKKYIDCVCAFDIETSYFKEIDESAMYIWQWSVNNDFLVYGRTWNEFKEFMVDIDKELEKRGLWLVVYVHNLSFEFQFLSGIYNFIPEQVMAVKSRKVLKCEMGHIEFRCSYLHSNMSLDEYSKKMGVEKPKLTGTFDYSVRRTSKTPLKDFEYDYCFTDVTCLVDSIKREMMIDGDDLSTIPLTSTGYLRREAKVAIREMGGCKMLLENYESYKILREAFQGGYTHANRYYSGRIIEGVQGKDRSSSYPEVMLNMKYPMSVFKNRGYMTPSQIRKLNKNTAWVARVSFTKIRLIDDMFPFPYLAVHKLRKTLSLMEDNGKIMAGEYLETTITDVDFEIISKIYQWEDVCFTEVFTARYGYLPESYKQVIRDKYKDKTELKDVIGMEVYYNKSKNKINAGYGMAAQDPAKPTYLYVNGEFIEEDVEEEIILARNKSRFMPYSWGVWTTALARRELFAGIFIVGEAGVYCDTDCVDFVKDLVDVKAFDEYNRRKEKLSKENNAYATDTHGITHYMGVYEDDKYMERFITLGAKKYAYERNGEIKITISGVPKSKGGKELKEAGGLEMLQPGFTFKGEYLKRASYHDHIKPYLYRPPEGGEIIITNNMSILPDTYRVSITEDYDALLDMSDARLQERVKDVIRFYYGYFKRREKDEKDNESSRRKNQSCCKNERWQVE